ncbi:MAG: hypothetical protein GF331_01170 [Chitinivibrionales bacterium]|nr:hypothetical protein [Chitinivibrionales bacterium]
MVAFEEPVGTTSNTYTYTIDKTRWLQTELLITGITNYHAAFAYDEFQGMPVLRVVGLYGDTTADRGGVEFDNVMINGELPVASGRLVLRAAAARSRAAPFLLVARHALGRGATGGSSSWYQLTGREAARGPLRRRLGQQLLIDAPRVRRSDP